MVRPGHDGKLPKLVIGESVVDRSKVREFVTSRAIGWDRVWLCVFVMLVIVIVSMPFWGPGFQDWVLGGI